MKTNNKTIKNTDNVQNKNIAFVIIFISIILCIFIFKNILNGEFIWDDKLHVSQNDIIKSFDLNNLFNIFIPTDKYMYHPITILSYMIDYFFSKENTLFYHIHNLVLHILSSIALFFLLKKLLKNRVMSAFAVLIFSIHPMHVESVAWISGRKELLYTLFYIISTIFYLNYVEKKQKISYFISILFFILSVLSKPSAAILFLTLLLIDYYYNNSFKLKYIYNKIPYIIIGLSILIIPFTFEKSVHSISSLTNLYPIYDRVFFPSFILLSYLLGFILPINISAFHSFPIKDGHLLPYEYYISLPIMLLLIFVIVKQKFDKKYLVFGLLYFIINSIMVMHIIPFGTSLLADRYTYNSYIGLIIPMSYYIFQYLKNKKRIIVYFIIFISSITFSFISYNRANVWKDNISLWTDVIEKNKELRSTAFAYYNRAIEYDDKNFLELSLQDYNECLSLDPSYRDAHLNRGKIKFNMGDYKGSLSDFEISVIKDPENPVALNNRGNAYISLKENDKALLDFNKSILISPNNVDALNNRGILFVEMGRYKDALNDYNKAIELNSNNELAFNSRAIAYFKNTDYDKAFSDWEYAIKLNNKYIKAYYNRAQAYYTLGKFKEAIAEYNNVIELNNLYGEAYYFRGVCYLYIKENDKACYNWNMAKQVGYKDIFGFLDKYCQ
ncbi:MAG: hypothetical protein A2X12_11450 [Bacteroidetes bacterium GWE2_29_8]|nr:MAG: hypothetical protein A2X12_11450 [Bacteroidetes bacterium GWE2_29_8]OFY13981.1 MAG: hypothetical protein A2X02_09180 [Bacteroidetes bacterium GWF2_29_10]